MKCRRIKELFLDFLNHKLDFEAHQKVQYHVSTCNRCRKELVKLHETLSFLKDQEVPEIAPDLKQRVMERIRKYDQEQKKEYPEFWIKRGLKRFKNLHPIIPLYILPPSYIKHTLKGLALVALVLLSFVAIYKVALRPKKDSEIRGGRVAIDQTMEKPHIIIETKEVATSLEELEKIITGHGGSLLREIRIARGFRISFSIEKEKEESLIKDLSRIGKFIKHEKGIYKNGQVRIELELQK